MDFWQHELYIFEALNAVRQDFESGMMSFYTRELRDWVRENKMIGVSYKFINNAIKKIEIERRGRTMPVFDFKKIGGATKYIGYVDEWDEFYSRCKFSEEFSKRVRRLFV